MRAARFFALLAACAVVGAWGARGPVFARRSALLARRSPAHPARTRMSDDGKSRASDAGRLALSSSDSGMGNINDAGPAEDRIAEVRRKVEKLRGMSSAINEAESLLGGKKAPAPKQAVANGTGSIPDGRADAAAAADRGEGAATATLPRTSSVGGKWAPPKEKEVETYKPSGSGSWGVFERPVDISKAMGGGRRIGVGAPPAETEEEAAAKAAETAKLLETFRKGALEEFSFERDNEELIEQALAEATAWMQRGEVLRSVRTLEPVWANCSCKSKLGGKIGLELGMAFDASGDRERAGELYETLQACKDPSIRRQAKQLKFGLEAMQTLGVGADADITGFSALTIPGLDPLDSYEQNFVSGENRRAIESPIEALAELRVAANDPALQRWSEVRIQQALHVLTKPANRKVYADTKLTGVWTQVLRVERGKLRSDPRLQQTIGDSAHADELLISRTEPAGPLTRRLDGTITLGQGRESGLIAFTDSRIGPIRSRPGEEGLIEATILVLDTALLVTMERARAGTDGESTYYVWAQQ